MDLFKFEFEFFEFFCTTYQASCRDTISVFQMRTSPFFNINYLEDNFFEYLDVPKNIIYL